MGISSYGSPSNRAHLAAFTEEFSDGAMAGGAQALDVQVANVIRRTLSGSPTITFSNPPAAGKAYSFLFIWVQDGTGGRVPVWPASVKWSGDLEPAWITTAGTVNGAVFTTLDGGATWLGFLAAIDLR